MIVIHAQLKAKIHHVIKLVNYENPVVLQRAPRDTVRVGGYQNVQLNSINVALFGTRP